MKVIIALFFLTALAMAQSGQSVLLWPNGAPGAIGKEADDQPFFEANLAAADLANGCAIVICPGGGYQNLALDHEGAQVAAWLNKIGVSAFILHYRRAPRYHHPAPLQDVQRAIRLVRSRAAEYKLDPQRIGVLGFSAGGHLAASSGTHFMDAVNPNPDKLDQVSSRPDFMVLVYPVITMTLPFTHSGSRQNLLGTDPSPEMVQAFSLEKCVSAQTPPAFLLHTYADTGVPVENSLFFYESLRKFNIPAELHVFTRGPHGFGMIPKEPELKIWPQLCANWLEQAGFLQKK